MPLKFEKHAQKGNEFLNELSEELGVTKAVAGKALRAVFCTLRDRLTLAENFQLLAQLPLALKGLYVDGWMPTQRKKPGKREIDFMEDVLSYEDKNSWPRLEDVERASKEVSAVFKTLKKYVSKGEFQDVEAILPHHLKGLLRESIYNKELTVKLIPQK